MSPTIIFKLLQGNNDSGDSDDDNNGLLKHKLVLQG